MTKQAYQSYIPIVLNLKNCQILIIGGGNVAERKFKTLLSRGGQITLVAPQIKAEIKASLKAKKIRLIERKFKKSDLKGQNLVFIMTDDKALNAKIAAQCQKRDILYNCATGSDQGFLMTSFFERNELIVAVSTRGAVPFLAKAIRHYLETIFDAAWLERIDKLKTLRDSLIRLKDFAELKRISQLTLDQIKILVQKI